MVIKNKTIKEHDILEDISRISMIGIYAWLTSFNSLDCSTK